MAPFEHARPRADGIDLPVELPYRVDALAATSALVYTWTLPAFQQALARRVESEPDLPLHLLARHLGMFGPQTPSALARALGMTRSNVSKIVARGETRALLERRSAGADRRSVLIHLTPTGQELANRTLAVGDAMMRELTAGWNDTELASWIDLSRRLSAAAAEYAERLLSAPDAPGDQPPAPLD